MNRYILTVVAWSMLMSIAIGQTIIDYRGLEIQSPDPTGAAGLRLQNNFKALADRIGPCNYTATTDPGVTDDSAAGYYVGSLWINTTGPTLWGCVDNTVGAADWDQLNAPGGAAAISDAAYAASWDEVTTIAPSKNALYDYLSGLSSVYQAADADLTTWAGVTSSANGRSLVSAENYAAMKTLLAYGTMADQAANSVAITGGTINGLSKFGLVAQPVREACITFHFDDGEETVYDNAFPVLQAKGVPGCVAIPLDYVDTDGSMTTAELLELQSAGWEIMSHGVTATPLATLTASEAETELVDSLSGLTALGLTVESIVYPNHSHDATIRKLTRDYYRSARGEWGWNGPVLVSWDLSGQEATFLDGETYDATLLDKYKAQVDKAVAEGLWLIFVLHSVSTDQATGLGLLIDYIQGLGVDIGTNKTALDRLGNGLDLGENFACNEAGFRGHTDYLDAATTSVDQITTPSVYGSQTALTLQAGANTGVDEAFDAMWEAVKVTATADHYMRSVGFRVKASGTITNPTAGILAYIYTDNAGEPGTFKGQSELLKYGNITTSYQTFEFELQSADNYLSAGTSYWIVVRQSAAPTGATISLDSAATGTGAHSYSANGSSWTAENSKTLWHVIYGRTSYGVQGYSTDYPGVYGASEHGHGVQGYSQNKPGVYGSSLNNYGGSFLSTYNYGVVGASTYAQAVRGVSTESDGGFFQSTNGEGISATSTNKRSLYCYRNTSTPGVYPVGDIYQIHASDTNPAFRVRNNGTGNILELQGSAGTNVVYVTRAGELAILSNTVGLKLNASGTTTIISDASNLTLTDPTTGAKTLAQLAADTDTLGSIGSVANGDVLIYNSGWKRLGKGDDGQVLKLAAGLPSWAADTDTNTTYTGGDGLTLTETDFDLDLKTGGGLEIDTGQLTVTAPLLIGEIGLSWHGTAAEVIDDAVVCPYSGTITSVIITANASGNIELDVWKSASGVPTVADTICNASYPALSGAQQNKAISVAGWSSTAITAGDTIKFEVRSVSTITQATVQLVIAK